MQSCSFCPKPRYEREEQPMTDRQLREYQLRIGMAVRQSRTLLISHGDTIIGKSVDLHRQAHGESSLGEWTFNAHAAFLARRKPLVCA